MTQSPEHIVSLNPKLAFLEEREPLVCSWRVHSGALTPPKDRGVRIIAREAARRLRNGALRWQSMECPTPGQIVVVAYADTPSTIGTVLPVMRKLADQGNPAFLVTTRRTQGYLKLKLHSGHADLLQIAAHVDAHSRSAIEKRAHEIGECLDGFFPGERSASWLRVGLAIRQVAEAWVGKAKAVITDSDAEVSRKALLLGARAAGVPTAILQQGLWGWNHFPLHAEKAYCWGPYFCDEAQRFGAQRSTLLSVGCPRFDHLPALKEVPRSAAIYKSIGKQSGKPLVFIISNAHAQPYYPAFYAHYFKTVEALAMSHCDVVVKPHPAEPGLDFYRANLSAAAFGRLRILAQNVGIEEAILHSDVVFQGFSTASIEAMLLGCPVLFEEGAPGSAKLFDFPDHGGGAWCSGEGAAEICETLARDGPERKRLLESQAEFLKLAVVNQGKAAAAVCELLGGPQNADR